MVLMLTPSTCNNKRLHEELLSDLELLARAAPWPLPMTFVSAGSIADDDEPPMHPAQGEKSAGSTDDGSQETHGGLDYEHIAAPVGPAKKACIAACAEGHLPVGMPRFASKLPPRMGEASRFVLDDFAAVCEDKEHVALCRDMFDNPGKFGLPAGVTASRAREQICLREHALGKQREALAKLVSFQVSGLLANGQQL